MPFQIGLFTPVLTQRMRALNALFLPLAPAQPVFN